MLIFDLTMPIEFYGIKSVDLNCFMPRKCNTPISWRISVFELGKRKEERKRRKGGIT
jgi:hypothetical protein